MNAEHLYQVIIAPHVSEKASNLGDASNQVVFKVAVNATKPEIKKAVEKLFKVNVESVQLLNVKGKIKRNRYGRVKKPDWKKAYVRLEAGQDIDFAVAI